MTDPSFPAPTGSGRRFSAARSLLALALLQVALGALAGVVWWWTTPTTRAYWTGSFWYSTSAPDYWVREDVGFAVCTAVPALFAAWWLLRSARRSGVLARYLTALVGSALGSLAAWGVGVGLGREPHPAQGVLGPAALNLHSLSLLAVGPALVSLIVAVWLSLTGLWSRDYSPDDLSGDPSAGAADDEVGNHTVGPTGDSGASEPASTHPSR